MCAETRLRRAIALLALALAAVPAFAAPDIQHWKTKNGTRVYFVETRELPIVDIEVVFAAGSARDPDGRHGLALLTSSLLDEGAGGLHANEVAYEFERIGASYGADADADSASVSLRSLSDADKLGAALANFERVLAKPDFPHEALERQKKRLLIAIQQKQQSPGAIAADAFQAAIYGNHPYAHPTEGTEASISGIGRDDVVQFHRRLYTAENAMVALVGDLSASRARAVAEEITRALPRGSRAAPVPPVQALDEARMLRIHHPSAQVHILTGQPGMRVNDPDYFPLYVGNHVLGGGGLVSRLFEEIREKRGLSYSAYSYFSPRREAGPFAAGLQTRADQAGEALAVLRESIGHFISGGPTAEELDASKKNITGGFPLRLDSNRKILGYVSLIGYYELPLDYLDTFNEKVEAVTAAQISDAFRRRLAPDRMATVMVGPVDEPAPPE